MKSNPTINPIEDVLARLDNVQVEHDGQWNARCPAHEDQRNSLAVSVGDDGKVLLRCLAGCDTDAVTTAAGLKMKDLFPSKPKTPRGRAIAYYDYRDETKLLLHQTIRYEDKSFSQRTPKPDGSWEYKLNGCRRVLYRYPEHLAADKSEIRFIPEGEKDVDNLRAVELIATTNVMGAGKWLDEYSDALAGYAVVILPDNDDAGRKHAQQVAKSLHSKAASVKILELTGLPNKGDVSDWLAAGGTKEKLLELSRGAAEWSPDLTADLPQGRGKVLRQNSAKALDAISPFKPEGQTDQANGRRLAAANIGNIRFCHLWGKWLSFTDGRWAHDNSGHLELLAKEIPDAMFKSALASNDAGAIKHAAKSASARGISAMLKMAESEPGVPIQPDEMNRDPMLFNAGNGTIELKTGTIREARREDLITQRTTVVYDPNAKCDHFESLIERSLNFRKTLVDYVQRLFGYCLTGLTTEQVLAIFHGVGANGKSTILNAILDTMESSYAMQANHGLLVVKRGESHPTSLASLFGRRLVVANETDDGNRFDEAIVKELTGSDKITARRMREDFWTFAPTHKLILATNHKPQVRGTDHAIWRRLRLIPFDVVIPDVEQDKGLPQKLHAERPGILAWMVRGCLAWQRDGLGMPDEVKEATAAYRGEQDVLAAFISDECAVFETCKVKATELYGRFREWCLRTGEHDLGQRRFGMAMTERGFERVANNGMWYRRIGLRNHTEPNGTNGTDFQG